MYSVHTREYLNTHSLEQLCEHNISAKFVPHKNCYILNYEQIEFNRTSPIRKGHPINTECRNLVLRQVDGVWTELSHSFPRFNNYGESTQTDELFAAEMKNGNVVAFDKLDGSLVQITYFDNEWHIFTRGSDADANPFRGMDDDAKSDRTFGAAVRSYVDMKLLDQDCIYICELCTPGAHITSYAHEFVQITAVYHRTHERLITDHKELSEISARVQVDFAPQFVPTSFQDLNERLNCMPADFEGYVLLYVQNGVEHRLKFKSESYKRLHHTKSNLNTRDNMINVILSGEVDEFLTLQSMAPFRDRIMALQARVDAFVDTLRTQFDRYKDLDQKSFALAVKDLKYSAYLFKMRKNPELVHDLYGMIKSAGKFDCI